MSALTNATGNHQPQLASLTDDMVVEGIYRVCHVDSRSTSTWSSTFLRLRDSSGTLECLPSRSVPAFGPDLAWRVVRVRINTFRHPTYGLEGRIESIEILDDVPEELVLDLLPHPRRVGRHVKHLRAMIESLSPAMQSFFRTVLRDDRITRGLIVNPASRTYHHTARGGLLAHSLETAQQAGDRHDLCQEERETAIVAGFFHDIGKALTLNHRGFRTDCGKLVAHESMTLEICAEGLRKLERMSRRLALLLRHIWTAAYKGQYGIEPKDALVQIVRNADRASARQGGGVTATLAAAA